MNASEYHWCLFNGRVAVSFPVVHSTYWVHGVSPSALCEYIRTTIPDRSETHRGQCYPFISSDKKMCRKYSVMATTVQQVTRLLVGTRSKQSMLPLPPIWEAVEDLRLFGLGLLVTVPNAINTVGCLQTEMEMKRAWRLYFSCNRSTTE